MRIVIKLNQEQYETAKKLDITDKKSFIDTTFNGDGVAASMVGDLLCYTGPHLYVPAI